MYVLGFDKDKGNNPKIFIVYNIEMHWLLQFNRKLVARLLNQSVFIYQLPLHMFRDFLSPLSHRFGVYTALSSLQKNNVSPVMTSKWLLLLHHTAMVDPLLGLCLFFLVSIFSVFFVIYLFISVYLFFFLLYFCIIIYFQLNPKDCSYQSFLMCEQLDFTHQEMLAWCWHVKQLLNSSL